MIKLRYVMWMFTIFYFLILICSIVFLQELHLEDHITTSVDFLEEWLPIFQEVMFTGLALSIIFSIIWFLLAWKYFSFGLVALAKPYYRICWATLFSLCVVFCIAVMRFKMGMPSEGKAFVYLFAVLTWMVPYYLLTLVYTPSGAKFVPFFARILRDARW